MPGTTSDPADVSRVYLDNAATTWPKSAAATRAALDFMENCGATAGRGVYSSAQVADRWLRTTRQRLGELISAASPQEVAICSSGTQALNAGLQGVLKAGDHVITTGLEHNSVLRPLRHLQRLGRIEFDVVPATGDGTSLPDQAAKLVRPNTRLLAVGHASNVTGKTHDLRVWSQLAEEANLIFMVDASQTIGYLPVSMRELGIDVLAAAGHKGLRAWNGTGFLAVSGRLQPEFAPWMLGGTGLSSESIDDVPTWPYSVEAGNLNVPAAISMAVAAEELLKSTELVSGWLPVFEKLVRGLKSISSLQLVGQDEFGLSPAATENSLPGYVPVVSIRAEGWDVHDLATILDTEFHIEARAGWHCAALVHEAIGTRDSQGTLRLSTGRSTTNQDVEYTLSAIRELTSGTSS